MLPTSFPAFWSSFATQRIPYGGNVGMRWETTPTNPLRLSYSTRPRGTMRYWEDKIMLFWLGIQLLICKAPLALHVIRCFEGLLHKLPNNSEKDQWLDWALSTTGEGRLAAKMILRVESTQSTNIPAFAPTNFKLTVSGFGWGLRFLTGQKPSIALDAGWCRWFVRQHTLSYRGFPSATQGGKE